jgi:peptidoglycan DL-endopeptidase CwlO
MKKTTIWTIVAVIIIAIGGGVFYATRQSTSNQVDASYNKALTSGKTAVQNKDYAKASSKFADALAIKKTAQAAAYKEQADNMLSAIKVAKAGKYAQALTKTNTVITKSGGYNVLISQGRQLKKTIANVQDNYEHEIKPILSVANQAIINKQYQLASDQYQKVLDLPYIDGKYYAKYKEQAQDGFKDAQKNAKTGDGNSSTQGYGVKSGKGKNSVGETGNAGKTGEGSMGNHKVRGKTVTTDQITQLRKRVTKLGFDGMSWSPQDLIDLFRSSKRTSPNKITKSDVQQYLKP